MKILRPLEHAEWAALGGYLAHRADGATFAIGDWLVYGGRQPGNAWIGSGYDQAAAITGYTRSHLVNCYRVATAFPFEERVPPPATWRMHRDVLMLPFEPFTNPALSTRRSTILMAVEAHWSSDDLLAYLRARLDPNRSQRRGGTRAIAAPHTLVRCPKCAYVFPVRGNKIPIPSDGRPPEPGTDRTESPVRSDGVQRPPVV